MRILVIDIGGTSIKLWDADGERLAKIPSGRTLTPQLAFDEIKRATEGQEFDALSIGFPGAVVQGKPARDAWNLGPGWVDFDYDAQFGKPVRMMNDAAMQALGSYRGGRMLFLGLGTSVGSTLVSDNVVVPLELGALPHAFGKTLEQLLARTALEAMGPARWRRAVIDAIPRLKDAFGAEYVVLGGGNAKKLQRRLPPEVWLGTNWNAFRGGCRLWECRYLQTLQIYEGHPLSEER